MEESNRFVPVRTGSTKKVVRALWDSRQRLVSLASSQHQGDKGWSDRALSRWETVLDHVPTVFTHDAAAQIMLADLGFRSENAEGALELTGCSVNDDLNRLVFRTLRLQSRHIDDVRNYSFNKSQTRRVVYDSPYILS